MYRTFQKATFAEKTLYWKKLRKGKLSGYSRDRRYYKGRGHIVYSTRDTSQDTSDDYLHSSIELTFSNIRYGSKLF